MKTLTTSNYRRYAVLCIVTMLAFSARAAAQGNAGFKVSGTVKPEPDMAFGADVVAVLFSGPKNPDGTARTPDSRAIEAIATTRRSLAAAAPVPANPWPYTAFQMTIERLRDWSVVSAAAINDDGKFEFPERVAKGTYLLAIGIPVSTVPGVSQTVPREWSSKLQTKMPYKLADREIPIPARAAWLLSVAVERDQTVSLGHVDLVVWPTGKPSDTKPITVALSAIDGQRKKVESLQKRFDESDRKARDSGQPPDVKAAREREAELSKESAKLTQSSQELGELIAKATAER